MPYIEGFVAAVPAANKEAYRKHAADAVPIFKEFGVEAPPKTIEEFIEVAKACTYTRADGTPVVGYILPGVAYPEVIAFARAVHADGAGEIVRLVAADAQAAEAARTLAGDGSGWAWPSTPARPGRKKKARARMA